MVVLRATRKVLRSLPVSAVESRTSDTALGDWYVNRLVVRRQPLLLLMSSASLLAVLSPAQRVRLMPERLGPLVGDRLRRLGMADDLIEAEVNAMAPVCVAPTASPSILGSMRDFMQLIPHFLTGKSTAVELLHVAEDKLAETPCRVTRTAAETIWPGRKARELLTAQWTGEFLPSDDGQGVGSSNDNRRLHIPFLDRASWDSEVQELGFGALLVVNFADQLLAEPDNVIGMMSRVRGLYEYLADLEGVQEVWFLRAIVSACEAKVRDSGSPRAIAQSLESYAAWLSTEDRNAEAADVQLMVQAWNAV